MIQGDAVGEDGISEGLAQCGDEAVEAAVRHRDGNGDHLALRRVEDGSWLVQLPVMGEPLWTITVRPEDVREEPDFFPRLAK